jgi:predicted nucleic acid-binding protein
MTTETIPSGSEPVLIDSSGWLEYLTEDSKAILFAGYFEGDHAVLVPTIVLYEVRKILLLRKSKSDADVFVSEALRRRIVDLDETLALAAVQVAIRHRLAMADAIIYATAQAHGAQLVTSDTHFTGLPGVTIL